MDRTLAVLGHDSHGQTVSSRGTFAAIARGTAYPTCRHQTAPLPLLLPAEQIVGRPGLASMARAVRPGWSGVALVVSVLEEKLPAAFLDHGLQLEAWKLSGIPSVPVMVVGEHESAGLHVPGAGP